MGKTPTKWHFARGVKINPWVDLDPPQTIGDSSRMRESTGKAVKNVLIAFVVGAIAIFAGGYATQKIATLQSKPILVPLLIGGAGILLLKRGRVAAGAGLAGAAGAIGFMQYQASQLSQQSGGGQMAGYGDAGHYRMSGGWSERAGAGALGGAGAKRLLQQQQALGPGEAGSLQGGGAKRVLRSQDAMGLEA